MTVATLATPCGGNDRAAAAITEQRSWALLGAVSLAIAGVFALLLAVSRVPGIEKLGFWPLGFFSKGLVIHVVFSLIVWFLAMFALLASRATYEIGGDDAKFGGLGRTGLALVAMSFPMLFLPAFHTDAPATLNNYVPVIIHPAYYAGLCFLALGILLPAVRLLAHSLPHLRHLPVLPFAMTVGALVFCIALICFFSALYGIWGDAPSKSTNEHLFWGGGHMLQFLNCILMLTGWTVLGREALGRDVVDDDIFKLAVGLIGAFATLAVLFAAFLSPYAPMYSEAFRRLQFIMAFPTLVVAVSCLRAVLEVRRSAPLPWHRPAFMAFVLSPAVFGAGGLMGLLITVSDTRTPAHYHGVIAGVQIACMGLMLCYALPRVHAGTSSDRWQRIQISAFAAGQFMASVGLFLAGGYGAPRKTPSGAFDLSDGAAAGMALHGIGALLAVAGGTMFVITLLRALSAPSPRRH